MIQLTIEELATSKGIKTQRELKEYIEEKTGVSMRAATISNLYRDNKGSINKEHIGTIMKALDETDFNKIMKIE